jgi:hypothetical protein
MTVRFDLFKQDGTPLVTTLNHQSGTELTVLLIVLLIYMLGLA